MCISNGMMASHLAYIAYSLNGTRTRACALNRTTNPQQKAKYSP
jgi:hypothetical protein